MEIFPPRAVVFDLDGVILDSFETNIAYYGFIARQMGLPPLSQHDQEVVHRETHEQALIHIAGQERFDEALAWGRDFNARQMQQNHKLYDGAREVISLLHGKVPLAVGTNRSHSGLNILRELGLLNYFSIIVTPVEAPQPKPHAVFMSYLLEKIGKTTNEVVYVGDSLVDEELCNNSGVRLVAFKNQGLNAWAYADEFSDIPEILGLA